MFVHPCVHDQECEVLGSERANKWMLQLQPSSFPSLGFGFLYLAGGVRGGVGLPCMGCTHL